MYRPKLVANVKTNVTKLQKSRISWFTNLFQNTGTPQRQHKQQEAANPTNNRNRGSEEKPSEKSAPQDTQVSKKKTIAQLDEELRQKMAGHSGEGGDAGVEYENGQPVAMKRSVKNNMFRYI